MRVTINPVLNLETMRWLPRPSYDYCGPVLLFKGDKTAQGAEVSGAAFDKQLMDIFTKQYGSQQGIINFLKQITMPIIQEGGRGYTPEQLTSMRTSATDTTAQQFENAQRGANAAAVRTGGSALPSGVSAQIESGAAEEAAIQGAAEQNRITQANANLQQQNYWNAINVLNGQSSTLNPLGYAEAPISGGNTVANLSGAVTQASGPSFGQVLGGLAGGAMGALGKVFTGGFAKGGAFAG